MPSICFPMIACDIAFAIPNSNISHQDSRRNMSVGWMFLSDWIELEWIGFGGLTLTDIIQIEHHGLFRLLIHRLRRLTRVWRLWRLLHLFVSNVSVCKVWANTPTPNTPTHLYLEEIFKDETRWVICVVVIVFAFVVPRCWNKNKWLTN